MEPLLVDYLSELELGPLQHFRNMGIIPLFTPANGSPTYVTMQEALDKELLRVTEVDKGGSVPELRVVNDAADRVLLIDGEELIGAKQNRVVNTSILLEEKSEAIIPVSCTEQGRWDYSSDRFASSQAFLPCEARKKKTASVSTSLNLGKEHASDQMGVWSDIGDMMARSDSSSATSAMADVFDAKMAELEEYLKAFVPMPRQKGLLAFINREASGMDVVSLDAAYKVVHARLVKSYAMDAVLMETSDTAAPSADAGRAFLEESKSCTDKKYDAVGLGCDYRLQGDAVVGSALVYCDRVIHAALFRKGDDEESRGMSSSSFRRSFRT